MKIPVLGRVLSRRAARPHCAVCDGYEVLSGDYVFGREVQCTCGAGGPDELVLHSADCDTVPCPFCRLLDMPALRKT